MPVSPFPSKHISVVHLPKSSLSSLESKRQTTKKHWAGCVISSLVFDSRQTGESQECDRTDVSVLKSSWPSFCKSFRTRNAMATG